MIFMQNDNDDLNMKTHSMQSSDPDRTNLIAPMLDMNSKVFVQSNM